MSYFDAGECTCGMVSHRADVQRHDVMCNRLDRLLSLPDLSNIKAADYEVLRASGVNVSHWECYNMNKRVGVDSDPVPSLYVVGDEAIGTLLHCLPVSFTLVNPRLPASVLELLVTAGGAWNPDLRDSLRFLWHTKAARLTHDYLRWVDCVLAVLEQHGVLADFATAMRDLGGSMRPRGEQPSAEV
jgi:hypothetical protein